MDPPVTPEDESFIILKKFQDMSTSGVDELTLTAEYENEDLDTTMSMNEDLFQDSLDNQKLITSQILQTCKDGQLQLKQLISTAAKTQSKLLLQSQPPRFKVALAKLMIILSVVIAFPSFLIYSYHNHLHTFSNTTTELRASFLQTEENIHNLLFHVNYESNRKSEENLKKCHNLVETLEEQVHSLSNDIIRLNYEGREAEKIAEMKIKELKAMVEGLKQSTKSKKMKLLNRAVELLKEKNVALKDQLQKAWVVAFVVGTVCVSFLFKKK